MKKLLEKADINGYAISDNAFEILQKFNASRVVVTSAELGGLEVHNPQYVPELYLSNEDYKRIYKNVIGDVLSSI